MATGRKCPWCKGPCKTDGPRNYKCESCGAVHDDMPSEGGDFSHDPTRRIQQQEERRTKRGHYDRYGKQDQHR